MLLHMTQRTNQTRTLHMRIPARLHDRVRIAAAYEGVSITRWVTSQLLEACNKADALQRARLRHEQELEAIRRG